MAYRNPVIPGFYPDPSVCRAEKDFYLAASSFAYSPGAPIFHSRDLVNWRQTGHALTRPSQLPLEEAKLSAGIWAPTLRFHEGTFYMVTTNKTHGGNFYVTAQDPAGPWSEPVWFDPDGWDPSFLFDDDGKVYLQRNGSDVYGEFGIVQYEMDVKTGKRLSEPRMIWRGSGGFGPEAPHLYKIAGLYYLMIAEGGTHAGHMETIARSESPWGPFESCPRNPILSHRDHLLERVQAAGHGDLVQACDGSWWLVFLGIRNWGGCCHMQHHLGRETFLAPVRWNDDGWPAVNGGRPVRLEMDVPPPPLKPLEPEPVRDDFDKKTLACCWNFLRHPDESCWSLKERPGWLALKGLDKTLNSRGASPAFIGRRQRHPWCRAAALLDFQPANEGEEAGLTVYMDEAHHYEIAVALREKQRRITVRRRAGDMEMETANQSLEDGPVILEIRANPWEYAFAFSRDGKQPRGLARAQTRLISTEAAGGFTGVYLGMYASAKERPCAAPAYFGWFDYEPLPEEQA